MRDFYNVWLVKFIWNRWWAITLFSRTFYGCSKYEVNQKWRNHENWHKHQQMKEPVLFYPKYLWFLLTRGYKNNPYEMEAREHESIS